MVSKRTGAQRPAGPSRARPRVALVAGAVAAVCLAAALAGCASRPGAGGGLPASASTTWTLSTLTDAQGTVRGPTPAPTLDLSAAGRVSGSNGCAPVAGSLAITSPVTSPPAGGGSDGSRATVDVRISGLVSPAIACVASNGIETRYGAALADTRILTVDRNTLTLSGADATLRYTRGDPSPAPSGTSTSAPTPTGGSTAAELPAAARRTWALAGDTALRIDLSTAGTILVQAGCPSFTGDLAVTGTVSPDAAEIRITRRPDTGMHCMAITADEQAFVSGVASATELRLSGAGLTLDGAGGTLAFQSAP